MRAAERIPVPRSFLGSFTTARLRTRKKRSDGNRTRVYSPPRASCIDLGTSGALTQQTVSGDSNSEGGLSALPFAEPQKGHVRRLASPWREVVVFEPHGCEHGRSLLAGESTRICSPLLVLPRGGGESRGNSLCPSHAPSTSEDSNLVARASRSP